MLIKFVKILKDTHSSQSEDARLTQSPSAPTLWRRPAIEGVFAQCCQPEPEEDEF